MMEQEIKKQFWGYRLLGIIDTFIAVLFLFVVLINFAVMGFSTSLLLPVFISLSVLLYVNLATVFARYVMVKGGYIRYRLKDWIKVNAYVTLTYAILVIILISWKLNDARFLKEVSTAVNVPVSLLVNVCIFFVVCMALLALHVLLTLRYLRRFADHFRDPEIPS